MAYARKLRCRRHGVTIHFPHPDGGGRLACILCSRQANPACSRCSGALTRTLFGWHCERCSEGRCRVHPEHGVGSTGCIECVRTGHAVRGVVRTILTLGILGGLGYLLWPVLKFLGVLAVAERLLEWEALKWFDGHAASHGHPGFLDGFMYWSLVGAACIAGFFLLIALLGWSRRGS